MTGEARDVLKSWLVGFAALCALGLVLVVLCFVLGPQATLFLVAVLMGLVLTSPVLAAVGDSLRDAWYWRRGPRG